MNRYTISTVISFTAGSPHFKHKSGGVHAGPTQLYFDSVIVYIEMYLATYFIGDGERALIMFAILRFAGLYGL